MHAGWGNWTMSARSLWIAVPTLICTGCYQASYSPPTECSNEQTAETLSNDRQWKAVTFLRQCPGLASGVEISVLPTAASLSTDPGNVFRQDVDGADHSSFRLRVRWESDRELWITHEHRMKVAFSASSVGAVTIVHKTGDISAD